MHIPTSERFDPRNNVQEDNAFLIALWEQTHTNDPAALEAFHHAIEPTLLTIVQSYVNRPLGMDVRNGWGGKDPATPKQIADTLALSVFLDVVERLRRTTLDPQRNVRGYIATIARSELFHQERWQYGRSAVRTTASATTMWYSHHVAELFSGNWSSDDDPTLQEPVDQQTIGWDVQLIDRMADHEAAQWVSSYWQHTCHPDDLTIIELRLEHDPALEWETIAARLGAGHNATAVRQRWHRILKRTRTALRVNQWI